MTEIPEIPTGPPDGGRPERAAPPAPAPKPRPQRRPLPSPLAVITAALGVFFIVLTLLAIQVRNGRDPALGPGPVGAASKQAVSKSAQTQQATSIVTRTSGAPPP